MVFTLPGKRKKQFANFKKSHGPVEIVDLASYKMVIYPLNIVI